MLRILARIVAVIGGMLLSIWIILLIFHLLIPNALIGQYYPGAANSLTALFYPIDRVFQDDPGRPRASDNRSNVLYSLLGTCYPDVYRQWNTGYQPPDKAEEPIRGREIKLIWGLITLDNDLSARTTSDHSDVNALRNKSVFFSSLLILLGMATTIFSALNSTELGTGQSLSTIFIKIAAIVLPAMVTALAAYGALFASPDQLARKAQVLYNLTNLHAEIDTSLSQTSCPLVMSDGKLDNLTAYEKSLAGWNRKFADIIATADYGQGSTKDDQTAKGGMNTPTAN